MSRPIYIKAPARICLFGDHQDYLGLPVIACSIARFINLKAVANKNQKLYIKLPDINSERIIEVSEKFEDLEKGDHFAAALRVVRRHGVYIDSGYNIQISGKIPINAGVSSSSALVVVWVHFLLKAFGTKKQLQPDFIAQLAYEAEVLEHSSPGGKMDQYTIGIGHVIFLKTGADFKYEIIGKTLDGLVLGESGIGKDTLKVLGNIKGNALKAIDFVKKIDTFFNIEKATLKDFETHQNSLPDDLVPYFYAAIQNHVITQKALIELKKTTLNYSLIGDLMSHHHQVLKNNLKITIPRIDAMIDAALNAGAYGAKIIGSGGGGCIVALAPVHLQIKISEAIKNAGAKDAYSVKVASGTKIFNG